jgi:hypothetical protein
MGVWYVSREAVKRALDIKETARNNARIDACIESASRSVEGFLHRRFYPELDTRYFDWPNQQRARSWRLWLDFNEMASITALVSGGVTLAPSEYFLRRADDLDEAPYDHIEIDLSAGGAFQSGSTHQRAIAATGVFIGCPVTEVPAGALAEALDDSETAVNVTNAALVEVGHIIKAGSERMIVTGKSMLDTGQNIAGDVAKSQNAELVAVADGTAYFAGEVILVDAERMLILDVAGNNLIVKRAWDGSTLAAHTTGADIYAARTLTVQRGALGTTAATHSDTTALVRFFVPGLVEELALAYTLTALGQGQASYARTVGSGDNERESSGRGLSQIKADALAAHGRQMRMGAV